MAAPPSDEEVAGFISMFGSVWALEVLILLRREGERSWTRPELVTRKNVRTRQ